MYLVMVNLGLVRVNLGPNLIDRKLGGPESDTSASTGLVSNPGPPNFQSIRLGTKTKSNPKVNQPEVRWPRIIFLHKRQSVVLKFTWLYGVFTEL